MADAVNENTVSSIHTDSLMNNAVSGTRSKISDNGSSNHSNTFENVDLNLDGDVEDADSSEEDSRKSDVQIRPKRKVKRKRRSKSLQHSTEENESSTDSECCSQPKDQETGDKVDPRDLNWTMWLWYYIVAISTGAFHVAEYMGEKLADLFGITAPKYQYVIDEYYRMKQEEREEQEREERERQYVLQREAQKIAVVEGGVSEDVNQV